MFYTVISKSGWQNDFWKVVRTLESKPEAEALKKEIHQRSDATQDHYDVKIKTHRKPLRELYTDDRVRFADGTEAW
jgi:hypothetical protein